MAMLQLLNHGKRKEEVALSLRPLFQVSTGTAHNPNNSSAMDIKMLCKRGRLKEAISLLHGMDKSADSFTYASLLQLCIKRKALAEGKLVHTHMNHTGFKPHTFLQNTLVNMYTKCGSLEDARRFFDKMHLQDVCSWTVMISAYARHGLAQQTLQLFHQMQQSCIQPNQFTFASILPACAELGDLEQGMEIHKHIIRSGFQSDIFVQSGLVDMYAKCGSIEDARQVFDNMLERDVHAWTAMIAAYAKQGFAEEALALFNQMRGKGSQPNHFTIASILPACADVGVMDQGTEIHGCIVRSGFESDMFVQSGLIDIYAKSGSLERAQLVFDKMQQPALASWNALIAGYVRNGYVEKALDIFLQMPKRDIVSWNAMISGYMQNGHVEEALKLFWKMPERSAASWNTMITGCTQNGCLWEAVNLFQKMPEQDAVSWNAMISAYAQNGYDEEAFELFQKMPNRNVVSWTALIAGYAQNGQSAEALKLFQQMQLSRIKPDAKTFASILPACANLAALEQGMLIHEAIIRSGFQSVVFVQNTLVDMYAKCGSLEKAYILFHRMCQRDLVSWNVMISGYAIHGHGKDALELYQKMQKSGITPNHVTLVCVLCACCHAGLVDEGQQYFDSMTNYYHVTPTMEHYVFMVDLLGRAGLLHKAEDFINKMPIKPDATVWRCLLGACRIHDNLELGMHAAEHLFELDSTNAANYVVMSNLYAAAGRWDDAEKVRRIMKDRSVKKMPGCSWIEVNKQVYAFLADNK